MTTHSLVQLDAQLNDMIGKGQILDAFDRFYADNVEMQENSSEPIRGKAACRKHEEEFLDSIATFHGAQLGATAVGDDVSFAEWVFDVTFKGAERTRLTQVAVRRWHNGQVVHERFYYDSAS